MPARLSHADVDRIALLARLELTSDERERFVDQLSHVLAYAEQIQQIDTAGVTPTSHVLSQTTRDRSDDPRASLANAEAVANAPDAAPMGGFFRVPRVIG